MKTITLTEEAYERLKAWKDGPGDSFSQVVLKRVPKRGTFGDLSESLRGLPALTDNQARFMEEIIARENYASVSGDPLPGGTDER